MTPEQMRQQLASRNAILSELNRIGLRPLAGSEDAITKWFADRNVTATTASGYLEMKQADGGDVVPSRACTTLRTEHPEFFASSPKFDKISSLEDFSRGTEQERARARAAYITKFGLAAFENLPRTREQAELKSAEIGPGMTAREYKSLTLAEKSRLAGIIGADGIAIILRRKG